MSAAAQFGSAPSSARMKNAVSAPRAARATTPAAPHIPIPEPALRPFSRISAFASSSSWRTRVVVSLASCLSSSPAGCSRRSWPLLTLDTGVTPCTRAAVVDRRRRECALLLRRRSGPVHRVRTAVVSLSARCLQEPRGEEACDDASDRERPRLLPSEPLDVVEHPVPVGLGQVRPQPLGLVGNAVHRLRGPGLALLAEGLTRLADRLRGVTNLLAGV